MRTNDELRSALEEHDLMELFDRIAGTRLGCIDVKSGGTTDIPLGASKFGGLPDLPPGTPWPRKGNRPLMFLAQIDLSRVPDLDRVAPECPRTGLLSFWYDISAEPWGFDPADRGAFQVLRVEGADLERRSLPDFDADGLDEEPHWPWEVFTQCPMDMEPSSSFAMHAIAEALTLPENATQSDIDRITDLGSRVDEFMEEISEEDGDGNHRMFGHPVQIQGDMQLECQLVSNGIYLGNAIPDAEAARVDSLKPGAADWVLLFQIDTDEDGPEWMWGDCGKLYFWIRKQDLAAGDFSQVWGVLQCY